MATDPLRGIRHRLVGRGETGDRFSVVLVGMQGNDAAPVTRAAVATLPV